MKKQFSKRFYNVDLKKDKEYKKWKKAEDKIIDETFFT
jgi:ribosomal protein L31E